ncbi:galactose-1-phosphate uridylyltransferase [Actinoplanes sp. NBRC 14428]|uniref:Galactose-1-phosphate uridylyltransferase n=1 Tax=Pseudosporangium ferrugineum TaxID=439699 RepID=A0A2T0S3W4_9ACTN|nr:galactose-1-phosphate uridylyltransferase [Pseudosporangium ferrugineum]PRY28118.1 UDPglucose--hexose-1-phosphate uridylyltransferase [Pseudosporangium ferrugineum]BCJ52246.1 galactose-1-phosphate uridylyltransferase [Actinoplanes sp. NBRC 14428]
MIEKRTAIRLTDGRELIYFDETPAEDRTAWPDTRELPPPPPTSQLRYDPLVDEWVAVAAHRQTRTFLPPSDKCPLCPSTPDFASEIPAPDYDVVVFENQFPSFSDRVKAGEITELTDMVPVRPGVGRAEVVCFTSDHNSSFGALTPERVRTVIDVLADRTTEMSALPGVEQVFPFENRGIEIGVTLSHPHGQIYAYPMITPRTKAMLAAARRHADSTGGRNLYADILAAEQKAEVRIVGANDHWTAYVPAAARWPFEVQLAPNRHVLDIPALTPAERDAFAPLYLDILRRFDALFAKPMPYIAAWHQAVTGADRHLGYLHLQLFSIRRAADKLKFLAGSESAMGAFINDIIPEKAAQQLREAL